MDINDRTATYGPSWEEYDRVRDRVTLLEAEITELLAYLAGIRIGMPMPRDHPIARLQRALDNAS